MARRALGAPEPCVPPLLSNILRHAHGRAHVRWRARRFPPEHLYDPRSRGTASPRVICTPTALTVMPRPLAARSAGGRSARRPAAPHYDVHGAPRARDPARRLQRARPAGRAPAGSRVPAARRQARPHPTRPHRIRLLRTFAASRRRRARRTRTCGCRTARSSSARSSATGPRSTSRARSRISTLAGRAAPPLLAAPAAADACRRRTKADTARSPAARQSVHSPPFRSPRQHRLTRARRDDILRARRPRARSTGARRAAAGHDPPARRARRDRSLAHAPPARGQRRVRGPHGQACGRVLRVLVRRRARRACARASSYKVKLVG
jgi:hypothetical protein